MKIYFSDGNLNNIEKMEIGDSKLSKLDREEFKKLSSDIEIRIL